MLVQPTKRRNRRKMETRTVSSRPQTKPQKPNTIFGYAARFNTPTIIQGAGRQFLETISPHAFTRTLQEQPDIRMLRDHDPAAILGRTKAGTLTVGTDAEGLFYECQLPDTTDGHNLAESIRRGDIDACSFGFTVSKDAWLDG